MVKTGIASLEEATSICTSGFSMVFRRCAVVMLAAVCFAGCVPIPVFTSDKNSDSINDIALLDGQLKLVVQQEKSGQGRVYLFPLALLAIHSGGAAIDLGGWEKVKQFQYEWPDGALTGATRVSKKFAIDTLNAKADESYPTRSGTIQLTGTHDLRSLVNGKEVKKWKCGSMDFRWERCLLLSRDHRLFLHKDAIYDADTFQLVRQVNVEMLNKFVDRVDLIGTPSFIDVAGRRLFFPATYSKWDGGGKADFLGYIYELDSGRATKIPLPDGFSKNPNVIDVGERNGDFVFLLEFNKAKAIFRYRENKLIPLDERFRFYDPREGYWDAGNHRIIHPVFAELNGYSSNDLVVEIYDYENKTSDIRKLNVGPN